MAQIRGSLPERASAFAYAIVRRTVVECLARASAHLSFSSDAYWQGSQLAAWYHHL